jgi:hypothetical protein
MPTTTQNNFELNLYMLLELKLNIAYLLKVFRLTPF